MRNQTLLKISAALILIGLTVIETTMLAGCGGCRPTADPARIQALTQRHSLTASDLATAVALECERQF